MHHHQPLLGTDSDAELARLVIVCSTAYLGSQQRSRRHSCQEQLQENKDHSKHLYLTMKAENKELKAKNKELKAESEELRRRLAKMEAALEVVYVNNGGKPVAMYRPPLTIALLARRGAPG